MSKYMENRNIINKIRGILRNEGITGMDSFNHCVCFLVCRLLDKDICTKLNIPLEFTYDNILLDKNGVELEPQMFYPKFYQKDSKQETFYKYLKTNISYENFLFKLKGPDNLFNIIKIIKNLDINNMDQYYDIVGWVFELHLKTGSGGSGMRDLGQYFTNRLVIKYMIELCDPKMVDGKIESIVDPSMGTGGFLTMAVKHLNHKYKDIDWSKNKDHLYGFDIDENVKNTAILNLLIETRELCNINLLKNDSLKNDMRLKNNNILEGADIVLANEPMGLKGIKYDECCDRIKALKMKGTKGEPLFLHLFMQSLNKNGRCAVVIPDGVLFNDSALHKNTRKYLIENFNLKKVIALNDKNFFLNTGVSTSILYFENNGKTTEVEFIELNLNQDETDVIEKPTIKVNYSKLVENNYTLFVNRFIVKEEKKIEGIEYKKLVDICKFLPTTKHYTSIGNTIGKYRFYNSSNGKELFLDNYEIDCDSLIVGNGGNFNIHYDTKFTASKHVTVMQKNIHNIDLKYLYYYLLFNKNIIEDKSAGSTISWLNKTNLGNINIPIPSMDCQKEIVERLDLLTENNKTCQKLIDEFKQIMKIYVETHTQNGENKKLGDVLMRHSNGKTNTNSISNSNEYPFYSACANNPIGSHNSYDFDGEKYFLFAKSGGNSKLIFGDNLGIGKFWLVSGKSSANVAVIKFTIKNGLNILYEYLNYYLKNILFNIQKMAYYTTGNGNINMDELNNICIPIPSINCQTEIVSYCDNIMNQINKLENQINDNNKLMKEILDNYLTVNDTTVKNTKSKIIKIKKL